jgi:spore photoproduct lyase
MLSPFSRIVIDRRAAGDPRASRVIGRLPGVETIIVEHVEKRPGPGTLLLRYHEGRFVKDFPVTPGAPPCGEKYIAALQGCIYDCSYCYLRSYLSSQAVTLLVNTPGMERDVREALSAGAVRLTTGELSDSLALDHITGLTASLLPMLDGTDAVLEARTKSANIDHILGLDPNHLLLTWTLAPDPAVSSEEPAAATLDERLEAISTVSKAGFGFALRLDPVIPAWWDAGSYRDLLGRVRDMAGAPRRIELGVLRFPPGLLERVRSDLPFSRVLNGEYVRDREGKMRLYRPARIGIYREMCRIIGEMFPGAAVELSQEDRSVWEDAGLPAPDLC